MLEQITLETLFIPPDYIMQDVYDGKRVLYLLFGHKWGNDLDHNGIGVAFHNENLNEIGFQSIAF